MKYRIRNASIPDFWLFLLAAASVLTVISLVSCGPTASEHTQNNNSSMVTDYNHNQKYECILFDKGEEMSSCYCDHYQRIGDTYNLFNKSNDTIAKIVLSSECTIAFELTGN